MGGMGAAFPSHVTAEDLLELVSAVDSFTSPMSEEIHLFLPESQ